MAESRRFSFIDGEGMDTALAYRLIVGCVAPRPVAWITSVDAQGRVNAAPFSSYNYVCHTPPILDDSTKMVPLLPPIDQWGALPLPLQRLSPHSLSRRARDLLAGDLGAHRDLPVDPEPEPEMTGPERPPVIEQAAADYNTADAAAAWDRRRRALQDLGGIIDALADVE